MDDVQHPSILGGALLAQERYGEAEALLLAGYDGMRERAETIGRASWPKMIEAIERLVELHDATGRPDESARWRAEPERARLR